MNAPSKPPSCLVPPRNWHFQFLAEHLRPDEVDHWLAVSGAKAFDPDVAARGYINTPGIKFTVLGDDGMPVAAGGFQESVNGVWQGWMVGTMEGWSTHWRAMTKAARWLMGQIFEMGARRLSVETIPSRTRACEWYARALGLQREGVLRKACPNGDDLVIYARVAGGA